MRLCSIAATVRRATHAARQEAWDGGVARSGDRLRHTGTVGHAEHLAASLFAFSATFEIFREDRIAAQIADESGIP